MFQKIYAVFASLLLIAGIATAQPSILPNLEGDALVDALVDEYKPLVVLTYNDARDVLFGEIDRQNDSVTCIYSSHQVYLPDGEDPTTYIFQNGSPNGINTEHTYPQSMGADFGAARSDMHHLFPARVAVNTARGSLPFAEIQDFETQVWYYLNEEQSNIPATNRDAYSEWTNMRFEPREAVKGDVARAMFYFYTMYRSQADAANPTFFETQRNRLCQWHYLDPADADEVARTLHIASYQGDKPNPFVLDCTVAGRSYCDEHPDCPLTSVTDTEVSGIQVFPNPARNVLVVKKAATSSMHLLLWSAGGQAVQQFELEAAEQQIDLSDVPDGFYFYTLQTPFAEVIYRGKLVIQKK